MDHQWNVYQRHNGVIFTRSFLGPRNYVLIFSTLAL